MDIWNIIFAIISVTREQYIMFMGQVGFSSMIVSTNPDLVKRTPIRLWGEDQDVTTHPGHLVDHTWAMPTSYIGCFWDNLIHNITTLMYHSQTMREKKSKMIYNYTSAMAAMFTPSHSYYLSSFLSGPLKSDLSKVKTLGFLYRRCQPYANLYSHNVIIFFLEVNNIGSFTSLYTKKGVTGLYEMRPFPDIDSSRFYFYYVVTGEIITEGYTVDQGFSPSLHEAPFIYEDNDDSSFSFEMNAPPSPLLPYHALHADEEMSHENNSQDDETVNY